VAGTDYFVPSHSDIDYYQSKGVQSLRLAFQWERMQPALLGPLDPTYLGYVQDIVSYASSKGMGVILDLHNFGSYGSDQLGDGTLTNADLLKEPNNRPSPLAWPFADQAAITAIRAVDPAAYIYVEGDGYSSAYAWVVNNPTLQTLSDPKNKLVFSAHSYADRDSSGSHFNWATEVAAGDQLDGGAPLTTNILVKRFTPFVNWLKKYGLRGQIGESGVGNNDPNWLATMDNGYAVLQANGISISQWAGGPGWGSYAYSVESG
jgi:endoglucanase